jgi:maleate cis-trans isomerase
MKSRYHSIMISIRQSRWRLAEFHKNNLFSRSKKKIKTKIYRTVILPVVLYGCETWSLTLREEHRLRVSENRVLRRIFGHKR